MNNTGVGILNHLVGQKPEIMHSTSHLG